MDPDSPGNSSVRVGVPPGQRRRRPRVQFRPNLGHGVAAASVSPPAAAAGAGRRGGPSGAAALPPPHREGHQTRLALECRRRCGSQAASDDPACLSRLGVPGCVVRWIKALLSDRRARVRWRAAQPDSRVFKEGLPQGSVLAPLLWLIFFNNIDEGLQESVSRSLFADDVALLADARSAEECDGHLQPCLDSIGTWLSRWKITPRCLGARAPSSRSTPRNREAEFSPGSRSTDRRSPLPSTRPFSASSSTVVDLRRARHRPEGEDGPTQTMPPGDGGEDMG